MRSDRHGKSTSVEVSEITPFGIQLIFDEKSFFLSFDYFPWFRSASVDAVFNVELCGAEGFYWPELDIDLSLEIIQHPEKFPLVSKARATTENIGSDQAV